MKNYRILFAALALTLVLPACGGGDDDDQTPDATTTTVDAPTTTIDAAQTDVDAEETEVDAAPMTSGCSDPASLTAGTAVTGTTAGVSALAPIDGSTCDYGAEGAEVVYSYTTTATADLIWTVTADFDSVAYIRTDCDTTDVDLYCADEEYTGDPESAVWPDAPAGTYYFIVDGFGVDDLGAFSATLTVRQPVALGDTCDYGVSTRCPEGAICHPTTAVCVDATAYCAASATGALTAGTPVNGDTSTVAADAMQCDGYYATSPEQYYSFTAASAGTYNVLATSATFSPYIYLSSDCTDVDASTSCTPGSADSASFDVTFAAGDATLIVVDGEDGETGAYTLSIDKVVTLNLGDACNPNDLRINRCSNLSYCSTISATCVAMVAETEPNNAYTEADAVAATSVIGGAFDPAADADWYAVTLTAGQTLVAQTMSRGAGSNPDTKLSIYAADGTTELAYNDDAATENLGSLAMITAATAGTYFVMVKAYYTTATFEYRLNLTAVTLTAVAETASAHADLASAQAVNANSVVSGAVAVAAETDWYTITMTAGNRLIVQTGPAGTDACDTTIDTAVKVYAADGTTILLSDTGHGPDDCSLVASSALAAGTYYVTVTDAAAVSYSVNIISIE